MIVIMIVVGSGGGGVATDVGGDRIGTYFRMYDECIPKCIPLGIYSSKQLIIMC
jgi:hypothetical protein